MFFVGVLLIGGILGGYYYYHMNGYRSIAVSELTGNVTATGNSKNGALFVGEHLKNGDFVSVADASSLTLCADSNKYLYADENTSFKIEYASTTSKSTIKIHMESGSTLNVLNEKLGENDVYEVSTPNSTMSVRGTSFRVTVYKDTKKQSFTLLEVDKGGVNVSLKDTSGEFTGTEELFEVGECAVIRADKEESVFVADENGNTKWELDYTGLPEDNVERLITILEEAGIELGDPEPTPGPSPQRDNTQESDKEPDPVPNTDDNQDQQTSQEHTHTLGDWETVTEPDCYNRGLRVIKCTVCGEIIQRYTLEEVHQYTVTEEIEDCEQGGIMHYYCTICQKTDENSIAPSQHQWGEMQSRMNGPTEIFYRTCTVCGKEVSGGGALAPAIGGDNSATFSPTGGDGGNGGTGGDSGGNGTAGDSGGNSGGDAGNNGGG